MRAKFINEIVKGKESAASALGIGKSAMPDVPKMLKKLAKTWTGKEVDWMNDSTTEMQVTYTHEDGLHKLEFDYSDIMMPNGKAQNPTVIYSEATKSIYVNYGKPQGEYFSHSLVEFYKDPELIEDVIEEFGENHEIIMSMFYNLDNLRKSYGSYSEYYKKDEPDEQPYDDRLGGGGHYY